MSIVVNQGTQVVVQTDSYTRTVCCQCSCVFFVPSDLDETLRRTGSSFYCPRGHLLVYNQGKSEIQRVREQLDATQRRCTWLDASRNEANAARNYAERKNRAVRGVVTKLKQRIASGACPCCSRRFEDLAKHMLKMHPSYPNGGDKP